MSDTGSGKNPVERYVLYGEPLRDVELHFLHAEPIRARSRRFDWTIGTHSHTELHQLLIVAAGCGTMQIEVSRLAIAPPALLVIPSGTVHAFAFEPGTEGWVVSVAESMVLGAAGPAIATTGLFARARRIALADLGSFETLKDVCESLVRELVWAAPAAELAIRGELLRLLAAAMRLAAREDEAAAPLGTADARLTDRFKQLVERDFRRAEPISFYAKALGVSEDRLLAACRRRFDAPPLRIVQRRTILEAQRWLVHTTLPVGLIGHELGFSDPAYFSRFFKRHTGETPLAYRARTGRVVPEPRPQQPG